MISREEIINTVRTVISELFPFLLRSGANTSAVILPEKPMSLGEQLEYVKRHTKDGFTVYAGYRDSQWYYGDISLKIDYDLKEESKSLLARAADFGSVMLVAPSVEVLKKLAAADESSPEVCLALYALTHKRKVKIVTDFDLSDITPGAFAKSMIDTYAAVADMGIEIVRSMTEDEENYDPLSGFLSEQMVRNAAKQRKREIVVSEKTVVTPLARDTADDLGIKIRVKL